MSMTDSLSGSQMGWGRGKSSSLHTGLQFPEEGQAAEQKEGAHSHGVAWAEQGLPPHPGPELAGQVSSALPQESDSPGFRGVQASGS